ncbi:MAG: metallophosphatase [Prevotella sp.]|nr:metallophosphatase [Prevotella sp.]
MKHLHIIILLALLAIGAEAKKQKQIVILHTNDTHSCIMPLKAGLADTTLAGRGGYLRRVAMIKEERQKNPDLLLFDSGDFSQGSSYYTMFKGDVEVGLMNEMGYDAATIGNHEFDFGLDNMIRIFKLAKFPIVCSNYDFADTELKDIVKPYITLRRQGVKIGVFALCPKMEGLVFTKNFGPLKYLDPSEVAQQMVNILREKEKCDLVICISHLGWEISDYPDNRVIENTTGIDLVLGGHTHTYLQQLEYVNDKSGRPVAVDQNGKHAAFVGRLVLNMEKK